MAITGEDLRNTMEQLSTRQPWPNQLAAIEAMREARPVGSPVEGGTPAQRRLEMEQAQKQFEEQMRLQREQMAMQERLARMARAAASQQQQPKAPQIDPRTQEGQSIHALVNEALRMGDKGLEYIHQQISGNYWKFKDPAAALGAAEQMFRSQAYTLGGEARTFEAPKVPLGVGPATEQFMPGSVAAAQSAWTQAPAPSYPAFADADVYAKQYQSMFPASSHQKESVQLFPGKKTHSYNPPPGEGTSIWDSVRGALKNLPGGFW